MRRALALLLFVVACSASGAKVDPSLVGTWELMVPNAQGVARWVWDIRADGSYGFHAEGPGDIPAHSGVFEARNGHYTLRSTTLAWTDTGTYQPVRGDTLTATGKLGTASWVRVGPTHSAAASDTAAKHSASAIVDTNPGGKPGVLSATAIYAYLSHHSFDDRVFDSSVTALHSVTVDPSAQEKRDGVTGIMRAEVRGPPGTGTVSFVIYRDRASAEVAHDADAMFDSKTFLSKPGEFVSSHAYTHRERGEARCLSRLLIGSSSTATVTCYLLVQYPTREPVTIESEVTEKVRAGAQEASLAAVQRAENLLFAGIKQWTLSYPEIVAAK